MYILHNRKFFLLHHCLQSVEDMIRTVRPVWPVRCAVAQLVKDFVGPLTEMALIFRLNGCMCWVETTI